VTEQTTDVKPEDKEAILSLVNEWVNVRGCGSLKERLNAALDAIESDERYGHEHVLFAYEAGKKILKGNHD